MEASSAFHRCLWQAFARPAQCRHKISSAQFTSGLSKRQTARANPRAFSSASNTKQDVSTPQPTPVSNRKNTSDLLGAKSSTIPPSPDQPNRTRPKPDPNNRIDLSSLPGIPPTYKPPPNSTANKPRPLEAQPEKLSARAKMDQIFPRRKPGSGSSSNTPENRFERTIRQTDALNGPSTDPAANRIFNADNKINISGLLENIHLTGRGSSSDPSTAADSKLPLRLRPTLGRTQSVDNGRGMDLNRAFRLLEQKCASNKVKTDFMKQRFHVRRGQRRKLDRSLRWRAAFKLGFLEECARVRRMKNQGW